jgi:hypothetical protein
VDQIPHARVVPVAEATPARHLRPAAEFLREHLPGNTAAEDEDNAGEARAIRKRAAAHLVVVVEESARTVRPDPATDLEAARRPCLLTLLHRRGQVLEVLLHALSACPLDSVTQRVYIGLRDDAQPL